jgi:hypothetical protein
MIPASLFPRLTLTNHCITSPLSTDYNCIGWSAGDTEHWWQPGVYWPIAAVPDDFGIAALEALFTALGFVPGGDTSREEGFDKVALYADKEFYTHAARQLSTGKWTSKLGGSEDIEHDTPEDVAGGVYGRVVQIMKRRH